MFNDIHKGWFRFAVLIVPLALSPALMAGSLHGLQAIKLLSPQVGFAANSDDLFWTTDAGNTWERKTPPTKDREAIEDVYFLNASVGWVLLARGDENDLVQFDLASTADAGKTWHLSHVEILDGLADDFLGHGSIYFVDSVHGWLDLVINSSSAFRPGRMLYTEDGGAPSEFFILNTNDGSTSSITCYCDAMFIDGDADVYGVQYPPNSSQSAFLYNPISAAYTIMAQAPAAGGAFGGVNDSLQIVSLNIFYDFPAKKQITIKPPGTYDSEATANGVNDYAEIVGTWTDSSFVTHAFLACPTGFASGCPAL